MEENYNKVIVPVLVCTLFVLTVAVVVQSNTIYDLQNQLNYRTEMPKVQGPPIAQELYAPKVRVEGFKLPKSETSS